MVIQIKDAAGRPVPGAVVSVASEVSEMQEIGYVTNDTGAFEVSIPVSGAYLFAVSNAESNERIRAHLEASAPAATLVFGGGAPQSSRLAVPSRAGAPNPNPASSGEHKSTAAVHPPDSSKGSEGWEGG